MTKTMALSVDKAVVVRFVDIARDVLLLRACALRPCLLSQALHMWCRVFVLRSIL